MPLQGMCDMATSLFGEYDPRTIFVFYAVEQGNNDIDFALYQILRKNEVLEMCPNFGNYAVEDRILH